MTLGGERGELQRLRLCTQQMQRVAETPIWSCLARDRYQIYRGWRNQLTYRCWRKVQLCERVNRGQRRQLTESPNHDHQDGCLSLCVSLSRYLRLSRTSLKPVTISGVGHAGAVRRVKWQDARPIPFACSRSCSTLAGTGSCSKTARLEIYAAAEQRHVSVAPHDKPEPKPEPGRCGGSSAGAGDGTLR